MQTAGLIEHFPEIRHRTEKYALPRLPERINPAAEQIPPDKSQWSVTLYRLVRYMSKFAYLYPVHKHPACMNYPLSHTIFDPTKIYAQ